MPADLSILWPTHNAQRRLQEDVERLLEIVTESTRHCEILVLDDGSDDLTYEVACELALGYPQVKAVGWRERLGLDATVQRGLRQTSAPTVLLNPPQPSSNATDLQALWRLRDEHERRLDHIDTARPGLRHLLQSPQTAEGPTGPFFLLRGARDARAILPRELDPSRAMPIHGVVAGSESLVAQLATIQVVPVA